MGHQLFYTSDPVSLFICEHFLGCRHYRQMPGSACTKPSLDLTLHRITSTGLQQISGSGRAVNPARTHTVFEFRDQITVTI